MVPRDQRHRSPRPAEGPPVEVDVERLSAEGEGVARWKGRGLFIPGALPGERARVAPVSGGKVQRGRLLEVLRPAAERIAPGCPLAGTCGGCDWLHLAPAAQGRARQEAVASALERLGRLDLSAVRWLPPVAAGNLGTRRRADLHWDGRALGFLRYRSHEAIPVDRCPALVGALADLPGRLSPLLAPLGRGLRSVQLVSEEERVSAALELAGAVKPRARDVARELVRSGLQGVVLVPEHGPAEDVGRPTLRGPAPLRPEVPLLLRPEAFVQAHAGATPLLVDRALALLEPAPGASALELYAGNGTFTFALAARVASVLAVESSAVSVRLAGAAAAEARLTNVRFVEGDAERVARGLAREGRRFDVLLADPPRAGAPGLAPVARQLAVRRLVYVACEPGALARDAAALVGNGFRLTTLQLVDMFPGTHHSETVAAFASGPE